MENKETPMIEPRRTAIMASAKTLFLNQGIEHTSISMISKEAGVAKSLFYYYFETKEELVLAIIEEICEEHYRYLEARYQQDAEDIFDGLLFLVDSFFNFQPMTRQINAAVFLNEIDFNIRYHTMYLEKIGDFIDVIVDRAQQEGYLFIDYPNETFVMMLEGLLRLHHDETIDLTALKIARIMEQTLHLPQNSLVEKAERHLLNFKKEVD